MLGCRGLQLLHHPKGALPHIVPLHTGLSYVAMLTHHLGSMCIVISVGLPRGEVEYIPVKALAPFDDGDHFICF